MKGERETVSLERTRRGCRELSLAGHDLTCAQYCRNNIEPTTGAQRVCASFNFDGRETCYFFDDAAAPAGVYHVRLVERRIPDKLDRQPNQYMRESLLRCCRHGPAGVESVCEQLLLREDVSARRLCTRGVHVQIVHLREDTQHNSRGIRTQEHSSETVRLLKMHTQNTTLSS